MWFKCPFSCRPSGPFGEVFAAPGPFLHAPVIVLTPLYCRVLYLRCRLLSSYTMNSSKVHLSHFPPATLSLAHSTPHSPYS